MTTYLIPPLVTEHETGPDDDCVFCSGVMQVLARWPGRCPATLTTAEALRHAAGIPDGPASSGDLVKGITVLFGAGYAPTTVQGPAALWAALAPGHSATVSGIPTAAPAGSPPRHWLPNYGEGHRLFAERLDTTDRVWLMDPEGPAGTFYQGEWCSKAALLAFAKDPARTHTIQAIKPIATERTLTCATTLRATPSSLATVTGSLPAGTVCTVVGTATNGWWTLNCGGPKSGRTWLHVTANGKSGYAPTGRFA